MADIAFIVFVVEVAGVGDVGAVVIEEELVEADGGEAGFGVSREDGGGIVDVSAETAGVEELDVIIVGEGGHGVFGVAGGVEAGDGDERDGNTEAAHGEDAEERIFRGGEFRALEAEAGGFFAAGERGFLRGFFGGGFAGRFRGGGLAEGFRAVGEADFGGGTLATGGDGVGNGGREARGTRRSASG